MREVVSYRKIIVLIMFKAGSIADKEPLGADGGSEGVFNRM